METKQFSNQTIYIRESHTDGFTYSVISNSLINDVRLNATEVGLMTKFLSNSNSYVFNSTFEQQASGLGNIYYNSCLKNLKQLGYVVKKNLTTGGIKWILIETKEIIQDLQELGFLTYNSNKKNWSIDESKFNTFQLTDFHHIAETQLLETQLLETQLLETQLLETQLLEINPLISTNLISIEEINKNEKSKNEKNKNEIEKGILKVENFSENLKPIVEAKEVKEVREDLKSNTSIEVHHGNSLNSIIENCEDVEYRKDWLNSLNFSIEDYSNYSDSFIANIVISNMLKDNSSEWKEINENLDYKKSDYGGFKYISILALKNEVNSNLVKELKYTSKLNIDELKKLFHIYPIMN